MRSALVALALTLTSAASFAGSNLGPFYSKPSIQWLVEDGQSNLAASLTAVASATDSSGNTYVTGFTAAALDGQALRGGQDFFLTKYNSSGVRQWTVEDGATGDTAAGNAVAVDSSGNVYVTGSTTTAIDGQTLHGTTDFFISQYNSSGVRQWTVEDGSSGYYATSYGVALDTSGDLYVTGYTGGALDGQTLHSTDDIFISKYSTAGLRQWTAEDGPSSGGAQANALSVDPSGNVIAVGYTTGAMDGQTLQGYQDMFLTKYNSSGTRQWTVQDGSSSNYVSATGVTTDASGNIEICGNTQTAIDGQTTYGYNDFILTKYSTAGVRQWTVEDGVASNSVFSTGIVLDTSGNAYISGRTTGALDSQTVHGAVDFFITSYNSSGTRRWTVEDGATGAYVYGIGVGVDSSGNVDAAAYTSAAVDGQTMSGTQDFFVTQYNSSQTRQWTTEDGTAKGAGTIGISQTTVDSSGNVYVTGSTNGSLDGQTHLGSQDFFITKYNSSGVRQWTVEDGAGTGNANGMAIALDTSGNVYVAGTTTSALDGQTLHGITDFFITKYNSSGVRQWTVEDGVTSGSAVAKGLAVDSTGAIYVAGYATKALDGQTLHGLNSLFITKYSSAPARQWTVEDGGTGVNAYTYAYGLALDSSSNVYVTGSVNKALDSQTLHGSTDFYITKYNTSGTRQWTVQDGTSGGGAFGYAIAVDASSNVYVTGTTNKGLDGQTLKGTGDLFLTKYTAAGTLVWTSEHGGTGAMAYGYGVAPDSAGQNVYVAGYTTLAAIDGQPRRGSQDLIVSKFNAAGTRQCTIELGVTNATSSGVGIATDTSSHFYVTGTTTGAFTGTLKGATDYVLIQY